MRDARRVASMLAVVGVGVGVWGGHLSTASAFCRTTTCNSAREKCEKDENNCTKTGNKIFWASQCVRYNFQRQGTQDLDPLETKTVISRSFQRWVQPPCPTGDGTITFSEGEEVYVKRVEYNPDGKNVNVVFFRDDDWPYKGIDGTLATTSVSFDKGTGEIWDADIAVNAAFNTLTLSEQKVEYDLESVMTHEIGHFIGIAHSGEPGAIMGAEYSPGTINRRLSEDDLAAVCDIYPPGRKAACNDEPRGGFGDPDNPANTPETCGCGAATQRPSALAIPALLLGLAFLRRRRQA
jgi:uncharacterized protein (TIGR03382 family)